MVDSAIDGVDLVNRTFFKKILVKLCFLSCVTSYFHLNQTNSSPNELRNDPNGSELAHNALAMSFTCIYFTFYVVEVCLDGRGMLVIVFLLSKQSTYHID